MLHQPVTCEGPRETTGRLVSLFHICKIISFLTAVMYLPLLDVLWDDRPKTVNNTFYLKIYILMMNLIVTCGKS